MYLTECILALKWNGEINNISRQTAVGYIKHLFIRVKIIENILLKDPQKTKNIAKTKEKLKKKKRNIIILLL